MGKGIIKITPNGLKAVIEKAGKRFLPEDFNIVKAVVDEKGTLYIGVESDELPENEPGASWPNITTFI